MTDPTDTTPDPDFAQGADTLVGVLAAAANDGYRAELRIDRDATVVCSVCDARTPADELTVERYRRLEGASDAADMMLVARSHCPACGSAGMITMGYGPNAGEHDEEFLAALDLREVPSGPTD
ncbi:MAG: hypothetical protein RIB98_07480 [Acidimicrobiales bacterium]